MNSRMKNEFQVSAGLSQAAMAYTYVQAAKMGEGTSWRDQSAGGRAMARLTGQNGEILMQFL